MSEQDFADLLEIQLRGAPVVVHVRSFEDAGLLTLNTGLVVSVDDGGEFQVTVVESKREDVGADE